MRTVDALSHDFSKVLKKFREDANLTQEELAHELHITQSHVSKYECGRKIIDLETFLRWVNVTHSEPQAALILFGADVCAQATTLIPTVIAPLLAV